MAGFFGSSGTVWYRMQAVPCSHRGKHYLNRLVMEILLRIAPLTTVQRSQQLLLRQPIFVVAQNPNVLGQVGIAIVSFRCCENKQFDVL